jgi:hypothetical protein
MGHRLNCKTVRELSHKVNVGLGVGTRAGYPINYSRSWYIGAVVLDNVTGNLWEVGVVTTTSGGTTSLTRGTLRECYNYLQGMHKAVTLSKGMADAA